MEAPSQIAFYHAILAAMDLLATSTGVGIAYGISLWIVLILAPMIATGLKGHWVLFVLGLVTVGIVWWFAALRLARPNSWWSRRFYGPDKLARARSRYEPTTMA